jgi:hypothetical protein
VPATKCDVPFVNRAFNWCFVPDTLVVVAGGTIDETRDVPHDPREDEMPAFAMAGWGPSPEVAAGVCVALAIGSLTQRAAGEREAAVGRQNDDQPKDE